MGVCETDLVESLPLEKQRGVSLDKLLEAVAQGSTAADVLSTLAGPTDAVVAALLQRRRFVILEGPPGTGKTEMATRLLRDR